MNHELILNIPGLPWPANEQHLVKLTQKHRVTGCYIKKRKKISFAHISTFKDFSLNEREELSNQEGLQATQIYYQGKLENHFQRHIKKLKSSMIAFQKNPF